jgi:peptidoglycan/xylan/chitin deacetylase (PgdA/CDA1 family)
MTAARFGALASLVAVSVIAAVIVFGSGGGSSTHTQSASNDFSSGSGTTPAPTSTTLAAPVTRVPILAYAVINVAPPQSTAPASLYVPADEFTSQMQALKAAGWHAVTLDQLEAHWAHGTPLGAGKPIVITFDSGYASQYTNALPVLKGLGWVAVENLAAQGLPPSEGGLTTVQVQALISAGWELDTQGLSNTDLTALSSSQLGSELTTARQTLQSQYNVPVNWFSYPSGHYNTTVIGSVQQAGFTGATTTNPGWASPQGDRFLLPRLQVTGGTTPSQLLSQISTAQSVAAPAPGTTTT